MEIISAPANALEIDPNLVGMYVRDVYASALIRETRSQVHHTLQGKNPTTTAVENPKERGNKDENETHSIYVGNFSDRYFSDIGICCGKS